MPEQELFLYNLLIIASLLLAKSKPLRQLLFYGFALSLVLTATAEAANPFRKIGYGENKDGDMQSFDLSAAGSCPSPTQHEMQNCLISVGPAPQQKVISRFSSNELFAGECDSEQVGKVLAENNINPIAMPMSDGTDNPILNVAVKLTPFGIAHAVFEYQNLDVKPYLPALKKIQQNLQAATEKATVNLDFNNPDARELSAISDNLSAAMEKQIIKLISASRKVKSKSPLPAIYLSISLASDRPLDGMETGMPDLVSAIYPKAANSKGKGVEFCHEYSQTRMPFSQHSTGTRLDVKPRHWHDFFTLFKRQQRANDAPTEQSLPRAKVA